VTDSSISGQLSLVCTLSEISESQPSGSLIRAVITDANYLACRLERICIGGKEPLASLLLHLASSVNREVIQLID
jgi:hypothetical protein